MSAIMDTILVLVFVSVVLGLGVWIYSGMLIVGFLSLWLIVGFPLNRIGAIMSNVVPSYSISWELAAIPMFILMGEIIFRTDITRRLFDGLAPIARLLPGGLLHINVLACTVFSAVCGSSAATTATVGRITMSELKKRGYNAEISSGSLAGAGTLGLLIPPSISLIIYGVMANVSIMALFAAGVVPGLMLAAMYSLYIIYRSLRDKSLTPASEASSNLSAIIAGLGKLWSIALLILMVMGSIYSGYATPSEAATVGVVGAIAIAVATRQFTLSMLAQALMGAVRVSCMICILVATAGFLASAIAYMHMPETITSWINSLELNRWGVLLVVVGFYVLLGTFLEGLAIIVLTLPITLPVMINAGFDPVWFGVFLIVMMEMSTLTPPVGLNLSILQGLTGDSFSRTVRNAMPFFLILCAGILIMSIFPGIVTWLPNVIAGR